MRSSIRISYQICKTLRPKFSNYKHTDEMGLTLRDCILAENYYCIYPDGRPPEAQNIGGEVARDSSQNPTKYMPKMCTLRHQSSHEKFLGSKFRNMAQCHHPPSAAANNNKGTDILPQPIFALFVLYCYLLPKTTRESQSGFTWYVIMQPRAFAKNLLFLLELHNSMKCHDILKRK